MSRSGDGIEAGRDCLLAFVCGLLLFAGAARADGLRIENVKVSPRDDKSATVTFDIAWSNSWHHGVFHDAAWVFFKVRANDPSTGLGAGKSEWQHVRLAANTVLNPAGYGQDRSGTPLTFVVPDGSVGMFVRRAREGVGAVSARGVTAVWDLSDARHPTLGTCDIRGFGVEMVYVPEGPFFVGKGAEEPFSSAGYGYGGMEQSWLYQFTRNDGRDFVSTFNYSALGYMDFWTLQAPEDPLPAYLVNSAGPIPTGREKGSLWAVDIKPEDKGEIPAVFPNGYAAFYVMKYPWITQGQYAAFLNVLTAAQAKRHYWIEGHGCAVNGSGAAVKRSGTSSNYTYTATEPEGMCPWLSWTDCMAYAAWAGLRPMTELEFEKAVRGPELAAPNDTSPSYWGVNGTQLSQIYERAVSIGDATGRAFAGTHGGGTLDLPVDWPPSYLEGVIFRGDYFLPTWVPGASVPTHLLIAGRTFPVYARSDRSNGPYAGWRGARSAPAPEHTTVQGKTGSDTDMTPFVKRSDTQTVHLARMKQPMRPDGVMDEWGKPLLTMNEPSTIYPTQMRTPAILVNSGPWRGPEDMSVKANLGWDGEALCVAAEVIDDVHCNTNDVASLWDGDSMQFGLIDAEANQTSLWLALTTNGVVFNPLVAKNKNLAKTAQYAVVRDETSKTTRYELRLPLADLDLKPGVKCCFYFMFFDNDGNGPRYRLQWAPIVTDPFKAKLYSKFVMDQ